MKTKKIDYFATSPKGTVKYLYSTTAWRKCKDALAHIKLRASADNIKVAFEHNAITEYVYLKDCKITARFDHTHKDYS